MDETYIYSLFAPTGQLTGVKLIRNKESQMPEGYGFVEFMTHEAAEYILRTYNGQPIPNTNQIFRLNWSGSGVNRATDQGQPAHSPSTCHLKSILWFVPAAVVAGLSLGLSHCTSAPKMDAFQLQSPVVVSTPPC